MTPGVPKANFIGFPLPGWVRGGVTRPPPDLPRCRKWQQGRNLMVIVSTLPARKAWRALLSEGARTFLGVFGSKDAGADGLLQDEAGLQSERPHGDLLGRADCQRPVLADRLRPLERGG